MDLSIGSKIRQLRKERGMTQERLAELVGISFQAISKWENNLALPDITLIPQLAAIFGVTTDELFSYNLKQNQEEIEDYAARAYIFRETDAAKAREILEEGLSKYPDNEILLNNLLYVQNYSENPDETIKTASKLISETSNSEIKYDALRFLAYAYNVKGDSESAIAALEQIPEISFSKLSEMAFILDGKPKMQAAQKQKQISFETLLQMMWKIAEVYESEGSKDKAILETQHALALIGILHRDENAEYFKNYEEYFKNQIDRMKTA